MGFCSSYRDAVKIAITTSTGSFWWVIELTFSIFSNFQKLEGPVNLSKLLEFSDCFDYSVNSFILCLIL